MARARSMALSSFMVALAVYCLLNEAFVGPRQAVSAAQGTAVDGSTRGDEVSLRAAGGHTGRFTPGRWNMNNKPFEGRFSPSANPFQYQKEGSAVFLIVFAMVFFMATIGNK